MIVVDSSTLEKIGSLPFNSSSYRHGDRVTVDAEYGADFFSLPDVTSQVSRYSLPVVEITKDFQFDAISLENNRQRPVTSDQVKGCLRYILGNSIDELLLDETAKVSMVQDPMSRMVKFRVSIVAVSATIEDSEKLFDLEVFTPC